LGYACDTGEDGVSGRFGEVDGSEMEGEGWWVLMLGFFMEESMGLCILFFF